MFCLIKELCLKVCPLWNYYTMSCLFVSPVLICLVIKKTFKVIIDCHAVSLPHGGSKASMIRCAVL